MGKLKFGAVGLGRLGMYHAMTIAYRLPEAELTAICSIDAEELNHAAKQLNFPYTYLSFEEILMHDLDGIILSTPSALHCQQIEKALERGLHVFCEKPLGVNLDECLRIGQLAEQHKDKVIMIGFMRRYDPSYQDAFNLIQKGDIGRPILFRGYSLDPVKNIEGAIKYAPHSAGQFLDMAIHDIDLSRWMLKSEPTSVFAIGGCYKYEDFAQYQDGDNVSALLQFQNDSMAFLFAGRTAPHGYHVESEIVGTEKTLRIASVPQKNFVEILDEKGVRQVCSQDFIERFGVAYVNELQEFVQCIMEGRKPKITLEDGIEATKIALAATQSFQEKQLIHL